MDLDHVPIKVQPVDGQEMIDEDGDRVVMKGDFDIDKGTNYGMAQCCLINCLSCMIPCAFLVPCAQPAIKRGMIERELTLTDHNLKYESNTYCCIPPFCFDSCLFKCQGTKKTIPLEKITDLTFNQGIIQRWFGVDEIMVQTASSGAQQAELQVIGLKDSKEFKRAVMNMKDAAKRGEGSNYAAQLQAQLQVAQNFAPPNYSQDSLLAAVKEIATSVTHMERMMEVMERRTGKYEKLKNVEE